MGKICIYNGTILTMNETFDQIENGVLVYEGDQIVAIGSEELLSQYSFDEMIDAQGGIILPGLINTHTHVSMSVFRSLGDDIKDRLMRYIIPMENQFVDEKLVYVAAKVGMYEMLLSGITTFVDMYYFEDAVAQATTEIGMRAILGETVLKNSAPDAKTPYGGLAYCPSFIEKWKGHSLITPAVAPHATYTLDEAHLLKCKELAQRYEVPLLIHLSETVNEMAYFQQEHGCSPVVYLDRIGFFEIPVIGAHLVYVDENDLQILKEKNVGVCHCIAANAKSGRSVSPAPKMLDMGIRIGLGTDGPMSGNHLDLIGLFGMYTKMHKAINEDVTMCKTTQAVALGTIEAAKAIGMDTMIGSLEVGKKADIIIVETKSPNMVPVYDAYSALTYSANPSNVVCTIVNGKVLMKDRTLFVKDYEQTMQQFLVLASQIKEEAMAREKEVK